MCELLPELQQWSGAYAATLTNTKVSALHAQIEKLKAQVTLLLRTPIRVSPIAHASGTEEKDPPQATARGSAASKAHQKKTDASLSIKREPHEQEHKQTTPRSRKDKVATDKSDKQTKSARKSRDKASNEKKKKNTKRKNGSNKESKEEQDYEPSEDSSASEDSEGEQPGELQREYTDLLSDDMDDTTKRRKGKSTNSQGKGNSLPGTKQPTAGTLVEVMEQLRSRVQAVLGAYAFVGWYRVGHGIVVIWPFCCDASEALSPSSLNLL